MTPQGTDTWVLSNSQASNIVLTEIILNILITCLEVYCMIKNHCRWKSTTRKRAANCAASQLTPQFFSCPSLSNYWSCVCLHDFLAAKSLKNVRPHRFDSSTDEAYSLGHASHCQPAHHSVLHPTLRQ